MIKASKKYWTKFIVPRLQGSPLDTLRNMFPFRYTFRRHPLFTEFMSGIGCGKGNTQT